MTLINSKKEPNTYLAIRYTQPSDQKKVLAFLVKSCYTLSVMRELWLASTENMTWLHDTVTPVPSGAVGAILYGNEDCPEKVEFYAVDRFDVEPMQTWFNPAHSTSPARWDVETGEWIKQYECAECGNMIDVGSPCCAEEFALNETEYTVVVGNVGTVYTGTDYYEAHRVFASYQDGTGHGRAQGEDVCILSDAEIVAEGQVS